MIEMFAREEDLIKALEEEIQKAALLKEIYGNWVRENPTSPFRELIVALAREEAGKIVWITVGIKNLKEHGYIGGAT